MDTGSARGPDSGGGGESAAALIGHYVGLGFSCAETTIRMLRDLYGIGMPDALLRMTSTFRGGASVDGRCGVIEAALSVFSYHSGIEAERFAAGSRMEAMRMFSVELQEIFEEKLGSIQCGQLWEMNVKADDPENTDCVIWPGGLIAAFVYGKQLKRRPGFVTDPALPLLPAGGACYRLHDEVDAFIIKEIEKRRREREGEGPGGGQAEGGREKFKENGESGVKENDEKN
jgi:C_GCAxxG_C_C family probable redox protein